MKSFLFCTSYCKHTLNPFTNLNHRRYAKWIAYYEQKKDMLGVDAVYMIDDGTKPSRLNGLLPIYNAQQLPVGRAPENGIFRFNDHFGRKTIVDFPGWRRSFNFSLEIAMTYGFERIVHIESDFFLLTERIFRFVREQQSGWTGLWSAHYNFPESGIQIICKDQFEQFKEFIRNGHSNVTVTSEKLIPFTHIEKSFHGDRLGERHVFLDRKGTLSNGNIDYIGQVPVRVTPESIVKEIIQ